MRNSDIIQAGYVSLAHLIFSQELKLRIYVRREGMSEWKQTRVSLMTKFQE